MNGDGNLYLAVALHNGSAVAILLGNGDGTFQTESDVAVGGNPYSLTFADLNGDGKLDLAVSVDQYPWVLAGAQGVAVALGTETAPSYP